MEDVTQNQNQTPNQVPDTAKTAPPQPPTPAPAPMTTSSASSSCFPNYDFPTIVNNSRSIQLICVILQLIFIYTESGSLPLSTFLFYSAIVGMLTFHLARRWYYSIDGRYDFRQMMREHTELTVRIQYAVAIFFPAVLGFISWTCIRLNNGLVHSLFHCTVFLQAMCAFGQLFLEFFEVLQGLVR